MTSPQLSIPLPVVVFEADCSDTVLGQSVFVVGSCKELGDWQVERATPLITSQREFPLWRSRVFQLSTVAPGSVIEFKLLIKDAQGEGETSVTAARWELCTNRMFRCPEQGQLARVAARFGRNSQVSVTISETSPASMEYDATTVPEETLLTETSDSLIPPPRPHILVTSPPRQDTSPSFDSKSPCLNLVAFEAPSKLRGALKGNAELPTAAQTIIMQHANSPSLRQKFLLIRDLLSGASCQQSEISQELLRSIAFSSIYAGWVATGMVQCHEDGGHHRPNQAAVAAQEIFNLYESLIHTVGHCTSECEVHHWELDIFQHFAREINPCLPSCSSQFTCSVPLTRIRDIAHRNDINQDLKREIKTRLQNKLHRCAGPEDLRTSEELLNRFQSNPSHYPHDFLHEYQIFHRELRDFFNASELVERLESLAANSSSSPNPRRTNAINRFLSNKFTFDTSKHADGLPLCEGLLCLVRSTTHLRAAIGDEIDSNAFRESPVSFFGSDPAHGQTLRIADRQAEKLLFTLLSRIMNEFEKMCSKGFMTLPESSRSTILSYLLITLTDGLKNFALSGFAKHLSLLIAQETRNALETGASDGRLLFMHCASVARRVLRLCEVFSDLISAVLPPSHTETFAKSLGVPAETGRIYGEGLIRASLSFQLSRVASLLLRICEVEGLRSSNFVTISAGEAVGLAVVVDEIENQEDTIATKVREALSAQPPSVANKASPIPLILLAARATGDEELEGLAARLTLQLGLADAVLTLAGMVLGHDIPTMSHLGVRARQQGLPFVALSSPLMNWNTFTATFKNKRIQLCSEERNPLRIWNGPNSEAAPTPIKPQKQTPTIRKEQYDATITSGDFQVLSGLEITAEDCGAKAASCQQLKDLTARIEAFAPNCLALPHWALGAALRWSVNEPFRNTVEELILELESDECTEAETLLRCESLSIVISGLNLAHEGMCVLQRAIGLYFLPADVSQLVAQSMHVMLRSSSNVEDLEGLSGAGLYESIPASVTWDLSGSPRAEGRGTSLANSLNVTAAWQAIKGVWASLYSTRAVRARRAGGVTDAWMGVLIQPMVPAAWSFVAHTRCPSGLTEKDPQRFIYVELARGLGEVLAGGGAELGGGRPTRLIVDKETGDVEVECFWDFWGRYKKDGTHLTKLYTHLESGETIKPFWDMLGSKLQVLKQLEDILKGPQDVEGCFVTEDVTASSKDLSNISCKLFIVQTRPQP